MLFGSDRLSQFGQAFLAISKYRNVGLYIFIDFGGIQLEVDDFGLFGIAGQIASNSVVESHAYGNQYIALVGQQVGGIIAMHPQFAYIIGMLFGKCS